MEHGEIQPDRGPNLVGQHFKAGRVVFSGTDQGFLIISKQEPEQFDGSHYLHYNE